MSHVIILGCVVVACAASIFVSRPPVTRIIEARPRSKNLLEARSLRQLEHAVCPVCLVFCSHSIAKSVCVRVRKELQAELLRKRNWQLRDLLPAAADPAVRDSTGRSSRSGRRGNPFRRSVRGDSTNQPTTHFGRTGYTSTRGSVAQSRSLSGTSSSFSAAPHDPRHTQRSCRDTYVRLKLMARCC